MASAGNVWEVFRSWKEAPNWGDWRRKYPQALKTFNAVHKLRKNGI